MFDTKYEYHLPDSHSVVPHIVLKAKHTGVIHTVNFYKHGDVIYLDNTMIDLPIALDVVHSRWGKLEGIPPTLEQCTNYHLQILGSPQKNKYAKRSETPQLPLDELTQIKEFEIFLRRTMDTYRAQR